MGITHVTCPLDGSHVSVDDADAVEAAAARASLPVHVVPD
jgi:hypothetical protein